MENRNKILIMLLISVVTGLTSFGICLSSSTRHYCSPGEFEATFNFLALFSVVTAIISIMLLFANKAFGSWKLFSIIYLLASILLITIAPNMGGMLGINKEFFTWWLAGIFFVISLGIIIAKRKEN